MATEKLPSIHFPASEKHFVSGDGRNTTCHRPPRLFSLNYRHEISESLQGDFPHGFFTFLGLSIHDRLEENALEGLLSPPFRVDTHPFDSSYLLCNFA